MAWIIVAIASSAPINPAAETRELYRIRLMNQKGGAISVSADGGASYVRVGSVVRPATMVVKGFAASVYAPSGTVAAVAVHGIRLKTASSGMFSIVPREFAVTPKGYGGHIAGSSGIYTDIPTGTAIFRNLAPLVGSPVFQEISGRPAALPEGYHPKGGDVIIISVQAPVRWPEEIVFENRADGCVDIIYPDGRETIARVDRPVRGVGRFDATGYTGVGRINTNHTGVITISTAPIAPGGKDGSGVETRGGFMIQPSRHAKTISHVNQVMVVAPLREDSRWLEGMPPLFSGYIGLAHDPTCSKDSFSVEVKTAQSDWMELPPLVGRHDDALTHMPNRAGPVTHIRIRFPKLSAEWIRTELQRSSKAYLEAKRAKF